MITWEFTSRGFTVGKFTDLYGQKCSVQQSSLATDDAIWLGVMDALWDKAYEDQMPYHEGGSMYRHVNARMHLTREQVIALLPALTLFAETGELPHA